MSNNSLYESKAINPVDDSTLSLTSSGIPTVASRSFPPRNLAGADAATIDDLLSCEDGLFLQGVYSTLLRRAPDSEGARYYQERLNAGVPKLKIIEEIAASAEATANAVEVEGLPELIKLQKLSRLPIIGRLLVRDFFSGIQGESKRRLVRTFYISRLLDYEDREFVESAYLMFLAREPDPVGLGFYRERLRSGTPKIQVIREILGSPEAIAKGVSPLSWRAITRLDEISCLPVIGRLLTSRSMGKLDKKRGATPTKSHRRTEIPSESDDDELQASWYVSVYPDVAASGISPLQHYKLYGKKDGRYPSAAALLRSLIDYDEYRRADPEIARLRIDPGQHYLKCGHNERRTAGVSLTLLQFDKAWYLKNSPDVQLAGVDPLEHFATQGVLQVRSSSSFRGLKNIQPEALSYFEPPAQLKAKVIAFYLPQYHPIPENDQWWGKGFTEWSNVTRTRPFYRDHDQPRLPGELGFYDLRLTENMRRQAELARNHGVHAFCFYIYWFGGKRLLERPVQEFLRQQDININFCLCWANENWTRRWDGLDSDVLMSQSHSPEDDIAFIAEISRAFSDPRYVKVGNKPVLVVYRPERLPDSLATTERWREWCRNNGIGEIHLCFTKSFSSAVPSALGMDAAIEFPPLSRYPTEITSSVPDVDPSFRGQIHSYVYFAKGAAEYVRPPYLEYRGVMPSWDNTARKQERGISFYGATPELYAEWLKACVDETSKSLPADNHLVFVNAWNEWGEGAYLEPDRLRGYAYLNKTREAIADFSLSTVNDAELLKMTKARSRIAVVVHLYYSDLLEYVARYLDNLPEPADLYFSVREGAFGEVHRRIKLLFPEAVVVAYPNHGRDVLPFLNIFRHIRAFNYDAVCKIHSKKSRHRTDGDRWRDDVLEKLLGRSEAINECLRLIRSGVGIIAPRGHLLPGNTYWGSNASRVSALAIQMNCGRDWLEDFVFPAGTMFWCRPQALDPLLSLGLRSSDFEVEEGQVDATTAHAVERLIGLSSRKAGLPVVETPDFGSADDAPYPFADSTSIDGKVLR